MDNSLSQPFEVKTFEGGITDFFLQAPSSYYEKADNFVVNNDLKLEVRWGSLLWDGLRGNHILNSSNAFRIDTFLLYNDESEMFIHSGRSIFYQNATSGVWTSLLGVAGNEPFSEGEFYSFASAAQWNNHLFITTTDTPLPAKLFRDETGALKITSVGLPQVKSPVNEESTATLAACIALANDLRSRMLEHFYDGSYDNGFNDSVLSVSPLAKMPPLTGVALHYVKDRCSAAYFEAQSAATLPAIASPTPTPAVAATDLASLYTLVVALCKAQKSHILDANTSSSSGSVTGAAHNINRSQVAAQASLSGPNISVSAVTVPETLEEARLRLNELRKLWNWHRLALNTHVWYSIYSSGRFQYGPVTDYSLLNKYPLTVAAVADPQADGAPVVTPNYGKFIGYVNALKYFYNGHVTNGYYVSRSAGPPNGGYATYLGLASPAHARNPGATLYEFPAVIELDGLKCELPDATTFDDACLSLYWVRALYGGLHYPDEVLTTGSLGFTYTAVAGSANITSVATLAGAALTLPVGIFLSTIITSFAVLGNGYATGPFGETGGVIVTASASGTATLSKPVKFTGSLLTGAYGSSRFHFSSSTANGGSAPTGASNAIYTSDEAIAAPTTVGFTVAEWIDLAVECYDALVAHAANYKVHYGTAGISTFSPYYLGGFSVDSLPPVAGDFLYAFVYKLTYENSDGVEFIEYSNPVQVEAQGYPVNYPLGYSLTDTQVGFWNTTFPITNVAQYGTVITGIPVLANTSKTNYDLTNIEIEIYRTISTGTTFYLLDTIANGTTTYTDTTNDTLTNAGEEPLNTRETLYTTGGVVGFDPPPRSKFLHILQNTAIYASIYDGEQYFPNRLLQSIPGTPAATNLTFYLDLDEAVTGLSSTRGNFLTWSFTKTYRLIGGYNELGQGNLSAERISDNVGCISQGSIVQTDIGIYFAGNDGFYFTDGFVVQKLSAQIDKTYQRNTASEIQRDRLKGAYDRKFRRVYWTMQSTETGTDCDSIFVLHTGYGADRTTGVFTKWANGLNFMPSALAYFQGNLVRGDYRGVVYYHDYYTKTDPLVPTNLAVAASAWNTVHIPWSYKSAALDFGTTFKGQWATRIHIAGKNVGNVGLQVSTIREDNNQKARDFSAIYWRENLVWGDANLVWGDEDLIWQYDKTVDEWRRFPTQSLRSQFRQIQFEPALIVVYKYEDYPPESFAGVTPASPTTATVTIATPPGFSSITWPLDCIGMTISFDFDDYTTSYEILSVSGATLTISDPLGALDYPVQKWNITGYMKEQRLSLTAYDIHFGFMGQRGKAAARGEGAGNGTSS